MALCIGLFLRRDAGAKVDRELGPGELSIPLAETVHIPCPLLQ